MLELNIINSPVIAEDLLSRNLLKVYDLDKVAKLCEAHGMIGRALRLFTKQSDIKRVLMTTPDLSKKVAMNQIVESFNSLNEKAALDLIAAFLKNDSKRKNMFIVHKLAERSPRHKLKILNTIAAGLNNDNSVNTLYITGMDLQNARDPKIHARFVQERIDKSSFHQDLPEDKLIRSFE